MLRHVSCSKADVLAACRAANTLIRGRSDYEDHFEADPLDLAGIPDLHATLHKRLQDHACLPVAMGHAKAAIEDKCAAFLHSTAMESANLVSLRAHLDNFVSWTTDLRVEVGIPNFSVLNWQSLLPPFLQAPLEADVPSEDDCPMPALNADPGPLMPKALIDPGFI